MIDKRVTYLLTHPEELLSKKPFTRGSDTFVVNDTSNNKEITVTDKRRVNLPRVRKTIISQDQFMKELDPMSHEVNFDNNLPSICVKLQDGGYSEIKFKRMPIPFQERIREKQTLSLCGNKRQFTLHGANPSDTDKQNFATFKEYWEDRNQDGMGTKAVYTQKGLGDVGLLFYFDRNGHVKSRLISYEDGYVIISHNDANGDRLLECIYYADEDGTEHADCYDDKYMYRLVSGANDWEVVEQKEHGFNEIPLVTKRGDVAWNRVQSLIEAYEILYNIYLVIQKRHGWGILYVKGKISTDVRQIAGSIILNDTSIDGTGSAEFKTPPSPQGTLDTLYSIFEQIQIGSSTTFLLPKDVKSNGDVSALAIMLTQSLDIEGATQGIIEWQNFVDKQVRLFKFGLAKELVNTGVNPNAITEFDNLRISGKFKIWRPFNENEYNSMLIQLHGAGILSAKTAIEKNTIANPDELIRIEQEEKANAEKQLEISAQPVANNAANQVIEEPNE